ncbi:MAG TPA: efflux RND transporter permease subunit [Bacteroidia bacterium]|nr:efflux RND transporter permease subunit [Bacteroidia bacterium]MBP7713915.1 efflux RND transporter permease subunit [Bacteroidia bacterium]MBP8668096.1 efflux RND transporter permease subunit [Bacteroidia bacterium]HOZ81737.1 efflux RND transporter permease subunit [Bacteroidia bacterium]HOZ89852.1 efflux RND transporter permease subunit [Bacteroidia bacterium]
MKITEISINRPTMVVVVFTILGILGLISYSSLNYELLPKFSTSMVTISTVYPGAGPDEVQNTVTKKIEDAVSSMENIKKLTSRSMEGVSIVTVEMNVGADANRSLEDAQRKINAMLSDLPSDAKTPTLSKVSVDDLPIITLSVTADMDSREFFDLLDQRLAPRLSRLPGVAQVQMIGGTEREFQINVDAGKLNAQKLSLLQLRQTITNANVDYPTGKIQTTDNLIAIRLSGKYADVDMLRNLVIKTSDDGSQVRLKDVADVRDGQKDVNKLARQDQKETIVVQITKQSDANAVTVSKEVHNQIAGIEKEYASNNLKMFVASDSSEFTLESANDVVFDLFIAIILVAVVMLLFLHSIRNSLIVMISIPLSLIITFAGMYVMGYSLNLMSLLALSLVVGILVDDAIVVLENIYRHMEMGKNKVRAAFDGVKEIGLTVTSITLVIVVVFLPISLTNSLVSMILRQFCITVVISTLLSLLVSFTVVPWLSSRFGKLEHLTGKNMFQKFILWFERQIDKFTEWITGILRWSLGHKRYVLIGTIVLLVASFMLLAKGFIGGEFIPKGDRGQFIVTIEMPKDVALEVTNQMTMRAENYLAKQDLVKSLTTTVGKSSDGGFGTSSSTPYKSEITVTMIDENLRSEPSSMYAAKIKKELAAQLAGAKITTSPVSIMGTAERASIDLVVTGTEQDSAMAFAKKALLALQKIDGVSDPKLSAEDGNPEVRVTLDRDKMALLGVNMDVVGGTMQTAFSGTDQDSKLKFREGEYEYDINLRYDNFNRKNADDVRNIMFVNNKGQNIRLSEFATISETSGPTVLERRDKLASVNVQAQVIGRPAGSVTTDFTESLKKLDKPAGVNYIFGGDAENQGNAFGTLGLALLLSIIIMYLIMVALYDDYVRPFVVLFSIPLSLIGALLALALTNNTLNIFSILGVIMLIGLVAKNAIMLVDFANQMKEKGESTDEALVHANNARLRPILMTTIAMVIGMLPIALASGGVAAIKHGLAWVIIGGLISSMFLTLIVVPVIYKIMDSVSARFGWGDLNKKKIVRELMHAENTNTADNHSISHVI